MFCKNCGAVINDVAAICVKCGVEKGVGTSFCQTCGEPVGPNASVCLKCGSSLTTYTGHGEQKSKLVAGLLGIFLGGLGSFESCSSIDLQMLIKSMLVLPHVGQETIL